MRIVPLLTLALAAAASAQTLPDNLRARLSGFSGTVTPDAKNPETGVSVGYSRSRSRPHRQKENERIECPGE